MRLTDLLIHKKFGQSKNVDIRKECIVFQDINAVLFLNEWQICNLDEFDNFISHYNFPNHKEFKQKDKDRVRNNFPKPQVLLTKVEQDHNVRVALALYPKELLTGNTLLHLRSINKFEQMDIRYFINYTSAPINEPKIVKHEFYEYCQSSDILFDCNFINNLVSEFWRLRIVTLKFEEFIMLMYAFDKNQSLSQEELNSLVTSFKHKPKQPINSTFKTI
ncbi:hypothetical protein HYN59_06200 [Flavobacterium album]|uniref:Uncharacterized protein n=1 Tax=Flavobacterium album TaxID=2175091 RepID=A0A2S1QWF2_9FLAO|nr:hypothetical protein [Flavobacterium album]AWH84737.1 hypothetical protein HYN59_06200 [Flavobacterium album]